MQKNKQLSSITAEEIDRLKKKTSNIFHEMIKECIEKYIDVYFPKESSLNQMAIKEVAACLQKISRDLLTK